MGLFVIKITKKPVTIGKLTLPNFFASESAASDNALKLLNMRCPTSTIAAGILNTLMGINGNLQGSLLATTKIKVSSDYLRPSTYQNSQINPALLTFYLPEEIEFAFK